MTGDLIINGVDMATKGITMGPGFIDALGATLAFKEDLENESALYHGKEVLLSSVYDSREVTLTFVVHGANRATFATNDAYLVSLLNSRKLTIKIRDNANYYRLVYTGKNTTYAHSPTGTVCRRAARFCEVNPNDRGATPTNPLFSY